MKPYGSGPQSAPPEDLAYSFVPEPPPPPRNYAQPMWRWMLQDVGRRTVGVARVDLVRPRWTPVANSRPASPCGIERRVLPCILPCMCTANPGGLDLSRVTAVQKTRLAPKRCHGRVPTLSETGSLWQAGPEMGSASYPSAYGGGSRFGGGGGGSAYSRMTRPQYGCGNRRLLVLTSTFQSTLLQVQHTVRGTST